MNNPYLYPGLSLGPLAVQRLVASARKDSWDTVTAPDRFTLREAVAHLNDWEPILRSRIKAAVDEPGCQVAGIDEGERAQEMDYGATDPFDQAQMFARQRAETIAYLQSLSPEDWHKTISHVEKGSMTVADQATMLLGHDIYHIEHLAQYMSP